MNYTTDFKSVRDAVSPEEWQTRVDLAACYRLMDRFGMTDLIYNHITAKIPGTQDHLLINLYGLLYKEITASSLVKIDIEGNVLAKPDTDYGINKSGYVIHGAIHAARPDATCVIHTHTRAGIAVAAMTCGLLPMSQTSMRFVGHIGYHDYEGPAVNLDEREAIVADLGPHDAMIMRNHGLLTCGATIQQAFNTMYQLELSCRSQVDAMAARTELGAPRRERARPYGASLPAGNAAALRRAGMAGDAANAGGRREPIGLSELPALSDFSREAFSREAWKNNAGAYERIRTMPFNAELAAGTLGEERFKHYITQDAHYLIGFGRALALAAAKAPEPDRIVQFARAAEEAIVVERALHGSFFAQYAISPAQFAKAPLSPACHHYVSYLLATAYAEPYEVLLGALLPCFWIYAEVGRDIHARAAPANPYRAWIDTYAGEEFHAAVRGVIDATDEAAAEVSAALRERMHAAFTRATQLEWMFWDSAFRLDRWTV